MAVRHALDAIIIEARNSTIRNHGLPITVFYKLEALRDDESTFVTNMQKPLSFFSRISWRTKIDQF